MHKYDDIINLPRKESLNHTKMPMEKRASIFSPFAALSGFNDKINEVERYKDDKILLSDDDKNNLDEKIKNIENNIQKLITITYFEDNNYVKIDSYIKKIDVNNRIILLDNKKKILFDDILNIEIKNNLE